MGPIKRPTLGFTQTQVARSVGEIEHMLKGFSWLGTAWLLGGCAAAPLLPTASSVLPASTASADFHSSTAVKLEQGNFVMVRTNVTGQSKGFALLGVLTLTPARFSKAMDRLYLAAEIRTGRPQTLANVVAERSSSYYFLFSRPRVTIRGDVIEFVPAPKDANAPP